MNGLGLLLKGSPNVLLQDQAAFGWLFRYCAMNKPVVSSVLPYMYFGNLQPQRLFIRRRSAW